MSEITETLPSDRVALVCKTCDASLTPREIATSTGLTRFCIVSGVCPLCTMNSLLVNQPILVNPNVKETPDA